MMPCCVPVVSISLYRRAAPPPPLMTSYRALPQDEESTRAPVVTVMDRLDVISVQSDASSIAESVASCYPGGNMQRLDEVGSRGAFVEVGGAGKGLRCAVGFWV